MEVIFVIIAAALYLLPTIVAVSRRHTAHGAIAVLNVFLGWTFVFWVIALVWACYEPRVRMIVEAPRQYVQPDKWVKEFRHSRGLDEWQDDGAPLAHCMAHSCYWPACYSCNMRAFGLHDEPIDEERRGYQPRSDGRPIQQPPRKR